MREQIQGSLNGHLIGYVVKEMVRRVSKTIKGHRLSFETRDKVGYSGKLDDVVTSADKAAQAIYVRMIREGFPSAGIIAEEEDLHVECTDMSFGDLYFTVDPLDGTKAFVRSQSHGIGTMVALVQDGEVIASCIGNVMTKEMYYYRPGGTRVHRIGESERAESLSPKIGQTLGSQVALLRDRPESYSTLIQRLLATPREGGLCKNYQTADGSVGLSMARLWNGEAGLAIHPAITTTPWDATPVTGINQRLGIVQLQQDEMFFVRKPYRIEKQLFDEPETIYMHESSVAEFMYWQERALELHR